jgi:hypothetical protein
MRLDDGAHGRRRKVQLDDEADAPRPIVTPLDGDQHWNRAPVFQLAAASHAHMGTTNPGVVGVQPHHGAALGPR